jgi:hypothetical protein
MKEYFLKIFNTITGSALFLWFIAHVPFILATVGSLLWIAGHYWKFVREKNEAKISELNLKQRIQDGK